MPSRLDPPDMPRLDVLDDSETPPRMRAAARQERLDEAALTRWANGFGIGLSLFHGWNEFVDQALFWSADPKPVATSRAIGFIHERLVAVEASPAAVLLWQSLTRMHSP